MVNQIADWELFLQTINNHEKLMYSGKLIEKLPFSPIVPEKVHRIIKKACHKEPKNRFSSASEMRNAIEKLCPLYNWKYKSEFNWHGCSVGNPQKDIYIEPKKNYINVIVCNNGRKSSQDSKKFENITIAKQYMFDYIKQTTIK